MRGYMELISFMKELSDGILDHLPEEQRVGQLTVEEVIEKWMSSKSYCSSLSLRKDIETYISLQKSGDFSVDEILSWYDLCFIPERFGVDEHVFFSDVLKSINFHMEEKRKFFFIKYFGWLGFK
ncbi:hypothetical protein G0D98_25160 [Pseudomonas savastanoi pv. phaseolicola]|uniref:Uncharacterized protein n=4 Tax=Pseudomonas TaxID=286 RepID=A0A3M4Z417_PSESG|nr:Uncharacterized protein ALO55_01467 [Pseudomonas savastanoi pv. phaseolicola]QDV98570.1 hypothetical protein FFH21_000485 [Pseudomonas sp. KBS0707]RMM60222.1 hypothetical protein ALQ74_101081 [Pseudomonas savastanoi pv. glycinea]MBN3471657.1 hypothetical protein [Pseudomonas savastanoi pv. phaseolicola]MBN3478628.1 hypothetical protein [Pseudomonas savastanoi pv. phaseolicola]